MESRDTGGGTPNIIERSVTEQTTLWGRRLRAGSDSLENLGGHLDTLGAGPAADLVRTGVSYAQRVASYLEDADLTVLLRDAGTFTREQPAIASVVFFALGATAGRVLRSGSVQRYIAAVKGARA